MQVLIQDHLPQIQNLMRLHWVEQAYLFGSAASATMNCRSDVDFLIRFSPDLDFEAYGNNYFKLMYALQDLLQTDVELIAEETISNPYFLESINLSKLLVL